MDRSNQRQLHITQVIAAIAAMLLLAGNARSASSQSAPRAGDEYEISRRYQTSDRTSDGGSGSSNGRDVILERVIAVREGGLELEYDLPKDATADDRARSWQFPARVFRPIKGPMQLLNSSDLEARVDTWLKAAEFTRADCGRWIFTWNAFRIECDPQSVIKTLEAFDLRSADIREGATYQDSEATGTGTLTKKATGPDGATFETEMEIDPDAVRRARADADVVAGEIMQQPVTLDAAMRERAKESVTGTKTVTFETDTAGNVRIRTSVTQVEIKDAAAGKAENRTVTETVERRPVSAQTTTGFQQANTRAEAQKASRPDATSEYADVWANFNNQHGLDERDGCYFKAEGDLTQVLEIDGSGKVVGYFADKDNGRARCWECTYLGVEFPKPPFAPYLHKLVMH